MVYRYIFTDTDRLFAFVRGRPTRVDAHLPTVDESFRTCCQWRTCSLYPIRADKAIRWCRSLSIFWRIRRRRARMHLPRHHVFAISDLAQKVWLFACAIKSFLEFWNVGFVLLEHINRVKINAFFLPNLGENEGKWWDYYYKYWISLGWGTFNVT